MTHRVGAARAKLSTHSAGRVGTGAAVLVALVVVLLVAGCGGNSDKKANGAYADGVCTAIAGWEQQIKTIATTFTGVPSKDSLNAKVDKAKTATENLVTEIKAVPPPNTSAGQTAKQQLDQLSTDTQSTLSAAESALSELPANPSAADIAGVVLALAPQVKNLVSSAESAVTSLKNAKGPLADAFKSTDSCKSLGGS